MKSFSTQSIDEHWKHLYSFLDFIKHNGLVVSTKIIKLFQTKIRFLGYEKDKSILMIELSHLLINFLILSQINKYKYIYIYPQSITVGSIPLQSMFFPNEN